MRVAKRCVYMSAGEKPYSLHRALRKLHILTFDRGKLGLQATMERLHHGCFCSVWLEVSTQGLTLGFLHDFALGYFANWGRNTSVSIWRKWKPRVTQGRSSHAEGQTSRGLSTSVNFDWEWLIDVWPSAWELLPWVFIFARWRWLVLTVRTPVLIPCSIHARLWSDMIMYGRRWRGLL